MAEAAQLLPRNQVPERATWDAASVYPSVGAWERACEQLTKEIPRLAEHQGRLGEGPETLLSWFKKSERVLQQAERVFVFGVLVYTVDATDQANAERFSRATSLKAQAQEAVSFARSELLEVGLDQLRRWAADKPALEVYGHYFDRLNRQQPHLRSGEVEALLAGVADPFYTAMSTYRALTDADLLFAPALDSQGNEIRLGQSNIDALRSHPDQQVRRTAWHSYADGYLAFRNTLANCLFGSVKQDVFLARARRHETALAAALAPEDIPVAVFTNLVQVFRSHLPIWHRYWRARRRAAGVKSLHPADIKAPLTASPPKVPFDQAVAWIREGLAPLGPETAGILVRGVYEQRWVDWAQNQGKAAGAFSSGAKGTHPFILMSYSGDLYSMSTLAHELGHSLHSYHAWESQPYVYSSYSLFAAEVASNFNQAMVRAHLFATQPEPDFQLALLEEAFSNYHRYLFLMPLLALFELEVHTRVERGEALSAGSMIALMAELFAEGYGGEVEIDHDRVGITWAQFPHLYEGFYVYQYATGIAAAEALSADVLAGVPGAPERYLDFLRAGGSRYPLEALRLAGVDLTSPEPIEQAFETLEALVDRLEGLLAGPTSQR